MIITTEKNSLKLIILPSLRVYNYVLKVKEMQLVKSQKFTKKCMVWHIDVELLTYTVKFSVLTVLYLLELSSDFQTWQNY